MRDSAARDKGGLPAHIFRLYEWASGVHYLPDVDVDGLAGDVLRVVGCQMARPIPLAALITATH